MSEPGNHGTRRGLRRMAFVSLALAVLAVGGLTALLLTSPVMKQTSTAPTPTVAAPTLVATLPANTASSTAGLASSLEPSRTPVPPTPRPVCGSWQIVSSPTGDTRSELQAVAAVARDDVWAVGFSAKPTGSGHYPFFQPGHTLVLHWDGKNWTTVPSPNAGQGSNQLNGLAALARDDVWAVGYYTTTGEIKQPLILHWDGQGWGQVSAPSDTGSSSFLNTVAGVGPNDVWAAGGYERPTQAIGVRLDSTANSSAPLLLHWDGTIWRRVPGPQIAAYNNEVVALAATAGDDAWALGRKTVYTGGGPEGYDGAPLALHWDGTTWRVVLIPGGGNYLTSGAADARDDAWAVGAFASEGSSETSFWHWDGRQWTASDLPALARNPARYPPRQDFPEQVLALSKDDVWAVGVDQPKDLGPIQRQTLILHWDGAVWAVVPSPNVQPVDPHLRGISPSSENELRGLAAAAKDDLWAVGTAEGGGEPSKTLILHFVAGVCP